MVRLSNINERVWFWLSFVIFAAIYASITLVNHYLFRTNAYDLGINNNAIYDYAHFCWNDCMLLQPQFNNVLADHFTLLPVLLSPLYWFFGSYTMLVVQYAAVLLGGYGIYKFCQRKTDSKALPVLAMIHFFCIWGIYSALSYDYHDNVMAAMFVPWLFYYFDKQKWSGVALFFVLIIIAKENMALWMVCLGPGLGLLYRQNRKMLSIGLVMGLVAAVYFTVVVKVIMPGLATPGRGYLHFNYEALGANFSEAFVTLFTRPFYALTVLFANHTGNPGWDGIKPELHIMVLLAGGWALFYRPQYLLMLLPIYAQKLFSDDMGKWGINAHYSIEFVPIITLAVFEFLRKNEKRLPVKALACIICAVAFIATVTKLDYRVSKYYVPVYSRFYSIEHYKQNAFDVAELNSALATVPSTAKVSATSSIVSHVSFRDYIYLYPYVFDADYVVLVTDPNGIYPLNSIEQLEDSMAAYRVKPGWEILYDKNQTLIAHHK